MKTQRTRRLATALSFALGLSLGAVFLVESKWLERVDLLVYDNLIRQQYRDTVPDIAIVAIDDKSLKRLGRWPWSRRVHAKLLDRLTHQGVRATGFDILMPEEERSDPEADLLFALAMERNKHTVLAVAPEQGPKGRLISESLPIPDLAQSAAAMGHVDMELDVDGLCRSVYLRAGLGSPYWPSFGLALMEVAYPDLQPVLDSERHPEGNTATQPDRWVRDQRILIPFAGPTGYFKRISYVDILEGRVPDIELQDQVILVGATAAGLGDALATPATQSRDRMPGVEMNANIANAVLEGKVVRELPGHAQVIINALVVFISVLILSWPVRHGLLMVMGVTTAVLLSSTALLMEFNLWFPPAVSMIVLLLSFPLWSWLQHNAETHALQRLRNRFEHNMRHHPITGLPNQVVLRENLQNAIMAGELSNRLSVMVIYLERRGTTDDRHGISGGERLLKSMADKLCSGLRETDMVAHISGDEFAVLIKDLPNIQVLDNTGRRLYETFQFPLKGNNAEVFLSPRIGVSLYPADGSDAETLIDNAFTAMYKARNEASRDLCYFTADMRNELRSRSKLENLLQHALQRGELEIHYQPQVLTEHGQLIGVEALLRWNSPALGQVRPDVFIPVAEHTGCILPIGSWVLEQACRQARIWEERGLGSMRMAVNLSPMQFAQDNLVEIVTGVLEKTGLSAHRLELEVTEGALMQDLDAAIKALSTLKRYGVKIAIDDFGTGYSSLSYLKRFPLDRIKIDRSFIVEVGLKADTSEITQTIISMAHRLKLEVIAEGVENDLQAEFLRTHACDEIQGYLYGRPVSASELERLLRTKNPDNTG